MPRKKSRKKQVRWVLPLASVVIVAGLSGWALTRNGSGASQIGTDADYEIIARYRHDANAYTQGLYFEDGYLIEGTGQRGESNLRRVEIETGRVLNLVPLPPRYFGEGVAALGDRIYQLTWQSELGFIYDREKFELIGQFQYAGEGWGLTTNGTELILSDGSATLRFLDPETFSELRRVEVHGDSGPIDQLNELEYINGAVYANVWHSNHVLEISPETGAVLRDIDFSGLIGEVRPRDPEAVLNGIAYDQEQDRLFMTGKLWPTMFEIRLR
jgi:glutamine cyclotransferase